MGLFFGNVLPSNIGGDVVRAVDLARVTRGKVKPPPFRFSLTA